VISQNFKGFLKA